MTTEVIIRFSKNPFSKKKYKKGYSYIKISETNDNTINDGNVYAMESSKWNECISDLETLVKRINDTIGPPIKAECIRNDRNSVSEMDDIVSFKFDFGYHVKYWTFVMNEFSKTFINKKWV